MKYFLSLQQHFFPALIVISSLYKSLPKTENTSVKCFYSEFTQEPRQPRRAGGHCLVSPKIAQCILKEGKSKESGFIYRLLRLTPPPLLYQLEENLHSLVSTRCCGIFLFFLGFFIAVTFKTRGIIRRQLA